MNKHVKVTTYDELPDGSWKKKVESYHERLSSIKEERIEHIKTTRSTFMADMIRLSEPITNAKTRDLELKVETDTYNNPRLITRIYTTYKEDFKKR